MEEVRPSGETLWLGVGVDEQGRRVLFVGDHRAMKEVQERLERKRLTQVSVSGYQVMCPDLRMHEPAYPSEPEEGQVFIKDGVPHIYEGGQWSPRPRQSRNE